MQLRKIQISIFFISIFFSLSVFSASPSTPILPGDNIQDPGDISTPWGGCTPLDSNCYVLLTSFTNESVTGLDYATSTGILSLTSGYVIPTTASTTAWDSAIGALGGSALLQNGNSFGNTLTLGTNDNNALNFETNGSTAMTILATGNVGIGTSTPADRLQVFGDVRLGTTGSNGCIKDFAGTGFAGTCSSDERLKTNIVDLSDGYLDKLANLKVITYNWNTEADTLNKVDTTVTNYGLLAQNVEASFPELVSVDSNGYKQVNYSRLPLYLLKAVQELGKKVIGFSDEFRTKKLCVGDTCINEEQLKILLLNQNTQPIIVNTSTSTPTPEPEVIDNDESTPTSETVVIEPVVVPTPEPETVDTAAE